jgi:tetraacyldisaccharide 4'-kinase
MNLLVPFGKLYGLAMDVRNRLYDRGILKSHDLGARTISVGNLTTGGTGKTPLVALIAEILLENNEKVCVLTRGYGRMNPKARVLVCDGENVLVDAIEGGDEPVELGYKLNGKVIIVADADRVAAAKWARERFEVTVFILDDGFQHRRAKRDLDIVCVDATNLCGNGHILPAGSLRESFRCIERADAVVITRTDQSTNLDALQQKLEERNTRASIFRARTELIGLTRLTEHGSVANYVYGKDKWKYFAFSGIGNPENFFATLRNNDFELTGVSSFPDHHRYIQRDIDRVESEAKKQNADALLTTPKDAVKLTELKFELPCCVVNTNIVINDPEAFRRLLISS